MWARGPRADTSCPQAMKNGNAWQRQRYGATPLYIGVATVAKASLPGDAKAMPRRCQDAGGYEFTRRVRRHEPERTRAWRPRKPGATRRLASAARRPHAPRDGS